jgi:cytochrome P450
MRPLLTTDSDIDRELSSAQLMVDPYPIYAKLRAKHPIFWSASWNAWIVSRYSDVVVSLRDNQNLSNENRQELLFVNLADDELSELRDLRHYFAQKDVIGSDPQTILVCALSCRKSLPLKL